MPKSEPPRRTELLQGGALSSTADAAHEAACRSRHDSLRADKLAQAALDALSAHIAILDRDGTIVAVNRSWTLFAQKHGAAADTSLEGANYLRICERATGDDAADAVRFTDGLRAVLAGREEQFEMEYPCQTQDELLWFTARITAFSDPDDPRVAVAHEDITARKNAEAARQENEEKYRALYENAPLAYQSLDADGCFLDVNPTWLRMLGYEREEVIGRWFGDFLHDDFKPHFSSSFSAFKERGHVSGAEFLIRRKDGRWRWIRFESCVGYHPDGSFKQTYCVFQDVTESHKALEALLRSEEEFRALADSLPVAITISRGPDQVSEYVNPVFIRMFGYPAEEIAAPDAWFEAAYPNDGYRRRFRDEWTRQVSGLIDEGRPVKPQESTVTCKDGSIKTVLWGCILIGEKCCAYGLDLTEQKSALKELQAHARSLERFNRAATGRELRMVELKKEVNALRRRLGQADAYPLFSAAGPSGEVCETA